MKMPPEWTVEPGLSPPASEESVYLVGWAWTAPECVRRIVGTHVYLDLQERAVKRLPVP